MSITQISLRLLHGPARWPAIELNGPALVDHAGRILANERALHRAVAALSDPPANPAVPVLQGDPVDLAVSVVRTLYALSSGAALLACAHVVDDILTEVTAGARSGRRKPLRPGSLLTMTVAHAASGTGRLSTTHIAVVHRLGAAVAAHASSNGTRTLRILSDVHRRLSDDARSIIQSYEQFPLGLSHVEAIMRAPRTRHASLLNKAIGQRLTVRQLRAAVAVQRGRAR